MVSSEHDIPHWNPVLFFSKDIVYLFYKVGFKIPQWHTMYRVSDDGGESWSQPKEVIRGDIGGRGPVKNKIIALSDGAWLAPASVEGEYWNAFVDISYDEGRTWSKSNIVPLNRDGGMPKITGKGVIQPTLWESKDMSVHMLLRSTEGSIYKSDSYDKGKTWSAAYPTVLPSNNSGIDLTTLGDGEIVLAYNPVGINWGERTPLILSSSGDGGATWKRQYTLEGENMKGEFSYPAAVASDDKLFVTYTWNRKKIAFAEIIVDLK